MKILFGIDPVDGWIRAASYLGHEGFKLNIERSFDCFNKYKPDLVIIDGCLNNKTLEKALIKFKVDTIKIDSYIPASDAPPDFGGGNINNDFNCDALIIGSFKEEYIKIIAELNNHKINYKIFGHGNWRTPRKLGVLTNPQIADAYKTAKWSIDLEADILKVLTIAISGGNPLSAGKWNVGVEALDNCPHFDSVDDLINKIKSNPPVNNFVVPTLSHRLSELLENCKC